MRKVYPILLLIYILAVSCVTQKKCNERFPPAIHDSISYVEKVKDTTIYITDSAGITALLECDSLGKVRIKAIQDMYAGQFVKPTVVIKNNYLKASCKIDSGAVYIRWKETHIVESKTKIITVTTNILTSFQSFQMWLGRILLIIVILFVAIKYGIPLIKSAFKIGI